MILTMILIMILILINYIINNAWGIKIELNVNFDWLSKEFLDISWLENECNEFANQWISKMSSITSQNEHLTKLILIPQ